MIRLFTAARAAVGSRTGAATIAVALVLVAARLVHAETADYVGKPVRAVSCASDGHPVTDPKILALIETAIGEPLSVARVRSSIAHLFSLGRFQDVRVTAAPRGDGVALAFDLIPQR